jgi:IS30 family transposase
MTHYENTTQSRKGKHLSYRERAQIEAYKNIEKLSNRAIARKLKRAPQTIHTEVKEGTVKIMKRQKQRGKIYTYYHKEYSADGGQAAYEKGRLNSGRKHKWVDSQSFLNYADEKILKEKWSPDCVIGHAKKKKLFPASLIPCTTTLYNWIDKGFTQTINLDLLLKTRRTNKPQKVAKNRKIFGDLIEKRPDIVDSREEFGHWEIDTVIGLKSRDEALLTLTERKTRYEVIIKIDGKSSEPVNQALRTLKASAGENFQKLFKTITCDNGSEFSGITELLKNVVHVYFTHPYSSWERGTNENHNGMIRRFIPKGTKISDVPLRIIHRTQDWMNNLPRRILGYATPSERMCFELQKLEIVA